MICPPPMAVRSKNRGGSTSVRGRVGSLHISGGRQWLSCRQPACLQPRQLRHGTERWTDRAIPKCPLLRGYNKPRVDYVPKISLIRLDGQSWCCCGLQVDIMTWVSSKHNMGMSLTRDTWNMIKNCSVVSDVCPSLCLSLLILILLSVMTVARSRVVSVLDSGVEGPGFKSQPGRCRVTVLGKLFTPIVPLFTNQRNW